MLHDEVFPKVTATCVWAITNCTIFAKVVLSGTKRRDEEQDDLQALLASSHLLIVLILKFLIKKGDISYQSVGVEAQGFLSKEYWIGG
jgi:hypothetical protein